MSGKKYMVFVEGSGVPKVVHASISEAKLEAHRLAEKEPNRLVRVLRVVTEMVGVVEVKGTDYD